MKDKLIKITSTKNNGRIYVRTFPAGLRASAIKYYLRQRDHYAAGRLSAGDIANLYSNEHDNHSPLTFTMYQGRIY